MSNSNVVVQFVKQHPVYATVTTSLSLAMLYSLTAADTVEVVPSLVPGVTIVCDEEARLKGLTPRTVPGITPFPLAGTLLLVSEKGQEYVGLTDKQLAKVRALFL